MVQLLERSIASIEVCYSHIALRHVDGGGEPYLRGGQGERLNVASRLTIVLFSDAIAGAVAIGQFSANGSLIGLDL